jgi:hypothetical protein
MRRIAFYLGSIAVVLGTSCRTTDTSPMKHAAIELEPRDGSPAPPPGPGDVSRRFAADRARVAKVVFKELSPGLTGDGDFAIDQDRGPIPLLQKSTAVESRIRQLRGFGPGGSRYLVEIRPEGSECVVIVRSAFKVDEAAALVLLDKIEADLKAPAPGPPASKS